jgi:hypothetical protein
MMTRRAIRHSRTREIGAASLLVALSLAPRSLQAQEAAPAPGASVVTASAAQRETARSWVTEGRELYAQRQYARALERFEAAWRLIRVPTTGIEVARTQLALGNWVEANAVAAEVANLPEGANEPPVFQRARAEASELVLGLSPRVPALALEIAPVATAVRIEIDGAEMPSAGRELSFRLNPGGHRLRVSAPGYQTIEREVPLTERERRTLSLVLVPVSSAAGGAERAPELAAVSPAALPPAPVSQSASAGGIESSADGDGARTRGHVALVVAGAAALGGSVTGILAFTSKPSCPDDVCELDQRDEADSSRRFGTIATVSFGVALAAGVYGLWELLHVPTGQSGSAPASSQSVQPLIVPRAAGATVEIGGTF